MKKVLHRAPVVVVLGHVDHGKTTLLDNIKKTKRAEKEVGNITQNIGAYEAKVNAKGYPVDTITFVDTPGHEAFVQMRARGASVADLAIVVIDATDSLMPQTRESLHHVKQAKIPYIIAINKIDLPSANVERVKKDLLKEDVQLEGISGDVPYIAISAKTGKGVNDLLELILLVSSQHNFTYDPQAPVQAYIIESQIDKAGVSAAAIIKNGSLEVGDNVYVPGQQAKVRAFIDEYGKSLSKVEPSKPFLILGFKKLPPIGPLSNSPIEEEGENSDEAQNFDAADFLNPQAHRKLSVIIKADSQGSLDAIVESLASRKNIDIVLNGVGEVSKSDIFLAKISKAVVICFNSTVERNVKDLAEQEKVIIKTYSLIYKLIEELEEVSQVISEKEDKEKRLKGEAKILATFILEREKIAGVKMLLGKLSTGDKAEIVRGKKIIGEAEIVSLKQRAKNVNEIKKNEEGGVLLSPQLDINIGDVIKSHSI